MRQTQQVPLNKPFRKHEFVKLISQVRMAVCWGNQLLSACLTQKPEEMARWCQETSQGQGRQRVSEVFCFASPRT